MDVVRAIDEERDMKNGCNDLDTCDWIGFAGKSDGCSDGGVPDFCRFRGGSFSSAGSSVTGTAEACRACPENQINQ
jgi:hypothetical protein